MADQRCPMCGKPNPQEAEECKYCGARLRPVRPGESKPSEAAPKPGTDDTDWMSDLRGDMMRNRPKTSMLPPEPPAPTPSDNWLSRIGPRGETESKPAAPASKPAAPASKPAAPASKPEGTRKPAPPTAPPQQNAAEHPDWLSKVRTQAAAARPSPASPEGEKPEEEPVWLKRLRARRTQDELTPTAPPESEGEPAAPGELPEWLSRIREKTAEDTGRIDAEDQSLFSSPLSAPPSGPSGAEKSASPWGTPAPPQKPRAPEPAASKGPDAGVPDWLKNPSDASRPPGEEPPVGSSDWMGSIASALEQTPPTPSSAASAKPGESARRPSAGRLLGAQDAAGSKKGGAPRPLGREPLPKTKKISPPTTPFSPGPVPPAPADSTPPSMGPDWDFPSETASDLPFDQLSSDAALSGSSAAFHMGTEPMVAPGGEEEIPDWLADVKKGPAAPATGIEAEPPVPTPDLNELLRPDALPEWMRKPAVTGPKGKEAVPAATQPAPPDNLEQGELPRWLEAMRPIQSAAVPTEDEERVESVGPLAGLRGVLSAEPVVAMPRRPGIMAGNIDASPVQLTLTETLRRLLIEPEIRASRKPVRAMLLTPLLRKLMSAILILSIVFPYFGGSIFSPTVYQPEANKMAGLLLNELPPDRPVLVAFEYDASAAPELETGATVLLEHLATRGIPVFFISTQPNGTILGEGLVQLNQALGVGMPALKTNFGYIPGGAGGLRRLAGDFRGTLSDTKFHWDLDPLVSIQGLSDFSLILVIAASPQSVRDWVEQVHTAVPSTPIVAMVSAASDALVFPYTQGSRPAISGLVAGYAGAQVYRAAYLNETLPASGSVAAMRWQAFAGGTLALWGTLLAGAIGSLAVWKFRKPRKAGE
jgi:hypothetical protein